MPRTAGSCTKIWPQSSTPYHLSLLVLRVLCITPFLALFLFIRLSSLQLCLNSHSTLVTVVSLSFCNIQRSLPSTICYPHTCKTWLHQAKYYIRSEAKSNKHRTITKLLEVQWDLYPIQHVFASSQKSVASFEVLVLKFDKVCSTLWPWIVFSFV
jgi:hypothetical protein